MPKYEFTLILRGIQDITDKAENSLYAAGCDDALLGTQNGAAFLDFLREAKSPEEAITSAVLDVMKAGFEVARVEPDDIVGAAEIGRRAERTRQNILQLVRGERGPGGFPPPVSGVRGTRPSWRWTEVAEWLHRNQLAKSEQVEKGKAVATINVLLDLYRMKLPVTRLSDFRKTISRKKKTSKKKAKQTGVFRVPFVSRKSASTSRRSKS
jgi:hypothetical protein